MISWIARRIHKTKIVSQASEDEQRAFVDALFMIQLADGSIELMENINFSRFMRLVDWKFSVAEAVQQSKEHFRASVTSLQAAEEYVEKIAARLPAKELRIYLLSRIRLYFLEGHVRQVEYKLRSVELMKQAFGIT